MHKSEMTARGLMGTRMTIGRRILRTGAPCVAAAFLWDTVSVADAAESPSETRPVHVFLRVEISPDAALVASVEGDAPVNGHYPALRQLVIRRVSTGAETKIPLPCGQVPQCWPDFPTWSADGRHLSFTLRQPGSHARAVYTVASDGAALTKQLDFNGTLVDLRYLPDGRLAMLATQDARKEVGATEAGAAVAGDLDLPAPEQRIAILDQAAVQWASPADLFVYEYDWRPDGKGFVGTAAPGDGDQNWWTARLYAFEGGQGQVLYAPTDIRQQIAAPKVSRDGRTVAFIAGLMSDFGSTGGDVYTLSLAGGQATNVTPAMPASATSLAWSCKNHLLVEELAGDKTQLVDLGAARQPARGRVLWSGAETLEHGNNSISLACPSGLTAISRESFTTPPQIQTGLVGKWKNLTAVNADMSMPA